ncbi:MAG: hypothetical protein A2Y62_20890, partial [Candidatus Fischerbacteria bacterium RBG_13_37_8]
MRKIIYIAAILFFASILSGQDTPRFGGTLQIGKSADITTLYPWEMTDLETMFVFQNIYEPLVRLKKENADIEPCLATDWTASKNYKTWTFHLRTNVKFHDGTPFNANSVIASFANRHSFPARLKKADDYTIVFSLDNPDAAFAITLSIEFYSIAGDATIKCYKEKCEKPVVVGTGPFMFKSWEPGKKLILVSNKDYWGGKPYLDEVIFIPFASNAELIKALKNHTVDISTSILPDHIKEIRGTSMLMFQSMPAMSLGYLGMNNEKPPFNKKEVRTAISYAINKKELINKYFLNGQAGMLAKNCLAPTMFGYDKELQDREYDPAKAKELLKEAGFPDGFETTLMPTGASRPYMPNPAAIAADVKKYLED